ncbi:SCO2322 family protein [Streptomyces sp. NPDC101062]|uniref:SCO2322 family protein n=1 Tax=unclassified Streptomyces TaxID=2593676 RepID=UPI002E78F77B|nr:SCO2322 family protein [Streptomyces sp. JV176]MEE1802812.1 SCO2322 family protein [Streptomyces sp. JV176]
MTRSRYALALTVALGLVLGAGAGGAQAAGYRYWSFWQATGGSWAYATQGPAVLRPADGTVTGFRFAVSADSGDAARPRTAPDFAAVCAATPARDGAKRIAVVVDAGTAADAPAGEEPPAPRARCARVGADATAADALAAVAKPLRYNSDALLCAISGYPESGCGEQVRDGATADPASTASPSPARTPTADRAGAADTPVAGPERDGGGPSLGLFAGLAAVAVLAVAGLWQARRRRG